MPSPPWLRELCRKGARKNIRAKRQEERLRNAVFWTGYSHCGHRLTAALGACAEFAQEWALQQSGMDGKEGHKALLVVGSFAADRFRERGNHCL